MNVVKVLADRFQGRIPIGKQGENKATAVQFCVKTWLEMWPGATVALAVQPPTGNAYPAIVTTQDNITTWVITAADTAVPGIGKCELRVLLNDVVKKSVTFQTYIAESFTADGEAPDPLEDWIEDAQAKLGEVDDALDDMQDALDAIPTTIDTALDEAKESGEFDGKDGVSPTITIEPITGGHRITITDADGTKTVDVLDGANGDDGRGISSIAKTGTSGLVDTYTITYTDNTTATFTVTNGKDGYSPTATVTKSGDTATISITDKNGTTTAQVTDGSPGPGLPAGGTQGQIVVKKSGTDYDTEWSDDLSNLKGAVAVLEPAATSGDVGKVPKVKTVADGKVSEYEFGSLPSVPVTDVQVNGASVLSNGVANVPYATQNAGGVVKIIENGTGGFQISQGFLLIKPAISNAIKTGNSATLAPIIPGYLDESVFYGLAKAAGADMKNITNTTVGQYPDAQKAAIQHMLGISNLLAPSETTTASKAYSIGEVFTSNGKLYKATTAIAAADAIVVQNEGETVSEHNAEECKVADYAVHDVQVNGTSVVSNGVANVPMAGSSPGVVKINNSNGIGLSAGELFLVKCSDDQAKAGTNQYRAIVPYNQHISAFIGLAKAAGDTSQSASSNAVGTYTEDAKSKISDMLNAPVAVSGTTPSITAKAGVRYICGEVATLTITAPASGIIDVAFDSGATPTVLTVTPPTGMTMRWIGDDPTALEANKHYEINIMDGCNGMVVSWT